MPGIPSIMYSYMDSESTLKADFRNFFNDDVTVYISHLCSTLVLILGAARGHTN
jgi:hypothetical protein